MSIRPWDTKVRQPSLPEDQPDDLRTTPSSIHSLANRNRSDSSLISAALTGQEEAFEELFQRYRVEIHRICRRYSRGEEAVAYDLCQESFVFAFLNLSQLRDPARFFRWISEVAKHKAISFRRKEKTRYKVIEEYQYLHGTVRSNETRWTDWEIELIRSLIQGIKATGVQETIRQFYFEGRSTSEIAINQKITQTAVTTRLSRFRKKMRMKMIEELLRRKQTQE